MLASGTSVSIIALLAFLTLEKVRHPYCTVLAACTHWASYDCLNKNNCLTYFSI